MNLKHENVGKIDSYIHLPEGFVGRMKSSSLLADGMYTCTDIDKSIVIILICEKYGAKISVISFSSLTEESYLEREFNRFIFPTVFIFYNGNSIPNNFKSKISSLIKKYYEIPLSNSDGVSFKTESLAKLTFDETNIDYLIKPENVHNLSAFGITLHESTDKVLLLTHPFNKYIETIYWINHALHTKTEHTEISSDKLIFDGENWLDVNPDFSPVVKQRLLQLTNSKAIFSNLNDFLTGKIFCKKNANKVLLAEIISEHANQYDKASVFKNTINDFLKKLASGDLEHSKIATIWQSIIHKHANKPREVLNYTTQNNPDLTIVGDSNFVIYGLASSLYKAPNTLKKLQVEEMVSLIISHQVCKWDGSDAQDTKIYKLSLKTAIQIEQELPCTAHLNDVVLKSANLIRLYEATCTKNNVVWIHSLSNIVETLSQSCINNLGDIGIERAFLFLLLYFTNLINSRVYLAKHNSKIVTIYGDILKLMERLRTNFSIISIIHKIATLSKSSIDGDALLKVKKKLLSHPQDLQTYHRDFLAFDAHQELKLAEFALSLVKGYIHSFIIEFLNKLFLTLCEYNQTKIILDLLDITSESQQFIKGFEPPYDQNIPDEEMTLLLTEITKQHSIMHDTWDKTDNIEARVLNDISLIVRNIRKTYNYPTDQIDSIESIGCRFFIKSLPIKNNQRDQLDGLVQKLSKRH